MLDHQNSHSILKIQKDLRLIKCHTAQSISLSNPRTCKNVSDLFKVLKMRNMRGNSKGKKQAKNMQIEQAQIGFSSNIFSTKIWQQKQKIVGELTKFKKNDKQSSSFSYDVLKAFQPQHGQSSKLGIYDHLDLLGRHQQLKICKQFRISNDYNKEQIQDLAQCLKHIVNISNPIKKPQNKTRKTIEICSQYKKILESISKAKSLNQERKFNLFQFIAQSQLNNQKKLLNGQWFIFALNLFKEHLKPSTFDPQKLVILQVERMFTAMSAFNSDQQKQRRFMSENLHQNQFWQKICYLFSKGHQEYALLQHHLKYKQEYKLLQHFNNIVSNKASDFSHNLSLFSSSQHYRQFVMLLQNKYLEYCLNNEQLPQNKMVYIALREIAMLHQCNRSYQLQLNYLNKTISGMIYRFKIDLILNHSNETIKKKANQLFNLGQFNIVLQLLYSYNKLQTMQYLLLLSTLYDVDVKHCDLIIYDHCQTTHSYQNLLQEIMASPESSSQQLYYFASAFLPPHTRNLSFVTNILTLNQKLFQFIVQLIGLVPAIKKFNLGTQHIQTILETSMAKNKNLSYCLQLALTSCFHLFQIPKMSLLSTQKRILTSANTGSMLISERGRQFQRSNLDILLNAQPILKQQKLAILLRAYKMLVKTNISLLRDPQLRKAKYEEITFANQLYIKISQKQLAGLWVDLSLEAAEKYKRQIKQDLNMIVLSYNMVKIKVSIGDRRYEYIVEVLNSLFQEEIAQSFATTVQKLKLLYNPSQIKDILTIFIADLVQSILALNQFKPAVIQRNRTILRYVCKEVHSFLATIKSNQSSSKVLFKEIQLIMSRVRQYGYF